MWRFGEGCGVLVGPRDWDWGLGLGTGSLGLSDWELGTVRLGAWDSHSAWEGLTSEFVRNIDTVWRVSLQHGTYGPSCPRAQRWWLEVWA
jgi:hypothetical protein